MIGSSSSRLPAALGVISVLALFGGTVSAQEHPTSIFDLEGRILETLGPDGRLRDLGIVPARSPGAAGQPPADRNTRLADAARACPVDESPGWVSRTSRGPGYTIDSCGRFVTDEGLVLPAELRPGHGRSASATAASVPVRIDLMTTGLSYGSYEFPYGTIVLLGGSTSYHLTDGTQWSSGSGSYRSHWAQLVRVEVSGTNIRYVLSPPEVGLVFEGTDYDSGQHFAQGKLGAVGPLVIEAEAGSTTAVLRGQARIVSNDPPSSYGTIGFNAYSPVVGSVVPFEMVYTITGGRTWTPDTFAASFTYSGAGTVDFGHPVSIPRPLEVSISGPSRVPDEFTTTYVATVRYDSGATRDESSAVAWTVEPSGLATVPGGVLTIGTLPTAEQALTLRAGFVQGTDSLVGEKVVRCLADDPAERPGSWPMFQANAQHTGYLPIALSPATFRFEWKKNVGDTFGLNPVAAGEGKVFATIVSYFSGSTHLFALDSRDGTTLWTKGYADVFSVNPPSFAYGNVYVQTGNHGSDTWLRAYDGITGDPVFKSPHSAQWERYLAPTLYGGKAYVNGGYYGGMYGFDAYTGAELWYSTLPQYDQWTPAVAGDLAFAYVGSYTPGLYVKDRLLGVPANYFVSDPNFQWNGWSMDGAPVVGSHGDVIAIHDGRLISFDPTVGSIRWEIQSQFSGQPSVAKDRIYAVDAGQLVVLDELTHAQIWTWGPVSGSLAGPMIVTDTHLFASTGQSVHAIDLVSHQSVWSYPAAGHLAHADDKLFVASTDGSITAISTSSRSRYYTVTPCRAVDTRQVSGVPVGGPALQGGAARNLRIGGNCGIPVMARAVSLNITVTQPSSTGGVSVYSGGDPPSGLPTITFSPGQTRGNNSFMSLNSAGDLSALSNQAAGATVHLVIDVNGYFQ